MYAMNLARFQRYPDCKQRGLRALPPLSLFTSKEVGKITGLTRTPELHLRLSRRPCASASVFRCPQTGVLSSKEASASGPSTGCANLPSAFSHSATTPSVRELLSWDLARTVSEWSRPMRGEGPADLALTQLGRACGLRPLPLLCLPHLPCFWIAAPVLGALCSKGLVSHGLCASAL